MEAAFVAIFANLCTVDGKPRFDQRAEEPLIAAPKGIFARGQDKDDWRLFDTRMMAITLRRASDAVTTQAAADPAYDIESDGRELSESLRPRHAQGG